MDVLIFIVIFGILPRIIKEVAKKQDKKIFESDDIENVKKELEKVKSKFKDFKMGSALESLGDKKTYKKVEVLDAEKSNNSKTYSNQTIKNESVSVYDAKVNIDEQRKVSVEEPKSKVKFKDKEDLRRAVIMSEILGKPRALKDSYR